MTPRPTPRPRRPHTRPREHTCTVRCVREPLHSAIAARLCRRVRSGEDQVGDHLPSEAELCAEFSTSRRGLPC
ncbi:GntR family transcriptional regulator [Streptomyces sp. NBC_00448]|uniref:GntR family transcriptional regulator n=1 Tax=Streptomyces sp. NBC_00448 TaxID=2903652 RepID=UPI003FA6AF67